MKPLLIVKTGSTYPAIQQQFGDFDEWLQSTCACDDALYQVWEPEVEPPPEPMAFSGVVITGSPAMVTEQKDWMRISAQWLLTVIERDIPVLGICFGHQLLAYALGGVVDYHPLGREIGTVNIELTHLSAGDDLFATFPMCFKAHVTHAQSVRVLPLGAIVLGGNEFEPHHIIRFRDNVWGVQFHPEFSEAIMSAYIHQQGLVLTGLGYDCDALLTSVTVTQEANQLLTRFVQRCLNR